MGKRVVSVRDILTIDEICEADDLIIAYKHRGVVYHLVGVYTGDGDVVYSFHPFVAQDGPEFTSRNMDDCVAEAESVRELMAFDEVNDFLEWCRATSTR